MDNLSVRLHEERSRLRLTQEALGRIGGVRVQAQLNYEKGHRIPDAAYLAAVAEAGVDILYVVTGQRSKPEAGLPVEEAQLLDNYRNSRDEGKQVIQVVASFSRSTAYSPYVASQRKFIEDAVAMATQTRS